MGRALDESIPYPSLEELKKTFMIYLLKYFRNYLKLPTKNWKKYLK